MECSGDLGWYGDTLPHRSKRLMILLVNSKIKCCPGNTSERGRSFMGSSCKGGKAQSALTIVAQQPNVDIRAINEDPVRGIGGYLHHEVFYLKGCTCGVRLCNSIKSNHPTVSISSLGRRGWV